MHEIARNCRADFSPLCKQEQGLKRTEVRPTPLIIFVHDLNTNRIYEHIKMVGFSWNIL